MTHNKDFKLLVDSDEFMDHLESRILNAKKKVFVQAMTFEADAAGIRVYEAMVKSKAVEKILCVDAYSLVNINDGWAYGWRYVTNKIHREEVNLTRKLLKHNQNDIKVVITNPIGFFGIKYPFRNHKKMMIVDDIAYLGGINFSNHNFLWHDFMVKIGQIDIVNELIIDFRNTCRKVNQNISKKVNSNKLFILDGINSRGNYVKLFDEIVMAKAEVTVLSPYVSDPLLSVLSRLSEKVKVNLITPRENNKSLMKNALIEQIRKSNFRLYEREGGMSHLKAILVDDAKLIFGSSNFDLISYYLEQEVVLVSKDMSLIEQFKNRILEPDLKRSNRVEFRDRKSLYSSLILLKILKKIVAILAYVFQKNNDY